MNAREYNEHNSMEAKQNKVQKQKKNKNEMRITVKIKS